MAGEISFSPIARETVDAKEQHDIANTIREFGKSARALRDVMDQGRALTEMDVLYIDNHFLFLQMAYLRWKWKDRPVPRDPA